MAERTVVQWDKDDLAASGIFKVDLLGLGMLTALGRGLPAGGRSTRASTSAWPRCPAEDPEVYDMLRRADTVGVFQVE